MFTVDFSTTTLGEYTFTLIEALDHVDGLDNNDLSFELPVYAVDTDGDDSLVSQLNVTIGDDVQIMQDGVRYHRAKFGQRYGDNQHRECDAKSECGWCDDPPVHL